MENSELLRIKSTRLLDFFPDELVIQKKTVSSIRRKFLLSYVETISIGEIHEVVLSEASPYAALTIIGSGSELKITHLPRQKAKVVKEIIEKLMV